MDTPKTNTEVSLQWIYKLKRKDMLPALTIRGIPAFRDPKDHKKHYYLKPIENWLQIKYLFFKKGDKSPICNFENIDRDPIIDCAFRAAMKAASGVQLVFPHKKNYYKPYGGGNTLGKIKEIARQICEITERYRTSTYTHPYNGLSNAVINCYEPSPLNNGILLLQLLNCRGGRTFIKGLNKKYSLWNPYRFVISVQILLDFELLLIFLQKKESILNPKPNIPWMFKDNWRERVMGRLMESICKLSSVGNEGYDLFSQEQVLRIALRTKTKGKGAWLRSFVEGQYNDIRKEEKTRGVKQRTKKEYAQVIANNIWPSEKFQEMAKRHWIYSQDKLETKIENYLKNHISKEK
jgi:hypothetical protein